MFGITPEKILLIGIVAIVIVGPQRLPAYAAKLATWVKALRSMMDSAKARMSEEMGPEFDDIDWKKLDPRAYDPRRIIRSALLDSDDDEPAVKVSPVRRSVPVDGETASAEASADTNPPRVTTTAPTDGAPMSNVDRWVKGIR